MRGIGWRAISALLLTALLGLWFWLKPDFQIGVDLGKTPEGIGSFYAGLFLIFYVYLLIQGFPISHGEIGSASAHNLDNIVSAIPALAAVFAIFLHLVGFHRQSFTNLTIGGMALAVVIYDLWVLGGAAAKINRLTDEIKSER